MNAEHTPALPPILDYHTPFAPDLELPIAGHEAFASAASAQPHAATFLARLALAIALEHASATTPLAPEKSRALLLDRVARGGVKVGFVVGDRRSRLHENLGVPIQADRWLYSLPDSDWEPEMLASDMLVRGVEVDVTPAFPGLTAEQFEQQLQSEQAERHHQRQLEELQREGPWPPHPPFMSVMGFDERASSEVTFAKQPDGTYQLDDLHYIPEDGEEDWKVNVAENQQTPDIAYRIGFAHISEVATTFAGLLRHDSQPALAADLSVFASVRFDTEMGWEPMHAFYKGVVQQ